MIRLLTFVSPKIFLTHSFTRQTFQPSLLQQVDRLYLLQKTRPKFLPFETMGDNTLETYLDTNQMTLGVKEGGGKSDNNPSVAYNNNVHSVWYTMVLMKGTDN